MAQNVQRIFALHVFTATAPNAASVATNLSKQHGPELRGLLIDRAVRRVSGGRPYQPLRRGCRVDGLNQPIDRACARVDIARREQQHCASFGLGEDHWNGGSGGAADAGGLIVAVIGIERDRQFCQALLPFRSPTDGSVGDLAERAVAPAETGATQ